MILRSSFRPQRRLQPVVSAHVSLPQRCAASTHAPTLTPCIRTGHRDERKRPLASARRGLATHLTGFEGHQLPSLVHGDTYAEHGVNGFLSPEGFDLAWTQYQSLIIEKLNQMTVGTADATTLPRALTEKYARSTDKASLFNHASMLTNNHFFFRCLTPHQSTPSKTFLADIEDSFSSLDTLRTEFIETADAMFGPGFVWMVKDSELGKMKLLCTYLAGSPFPGAHFRSQQMDMATQPAAVAKSSPFARQPTNPTGSFGAYSRAWQGHQRGPGSYNSNPVLGVNTWEHAYLRDYGIGGKRAYLERWWDRIDWAVVEENAKRFGPEARSVGSILNSAFRRHQATSSWY